MRLSVVALACAVLCLCIAAPMLLVAEATVAAGEIHGHTVSYVRELTDATFEHDTQATTGSTTGDWFVEFHAPWCGHCKSLKPVWDQLAAKVRDERVPISIAAIDATVHTSTAKRFDIRGFPSLRVISAGRVYEYSGPRTLDALFKFVEDRAWLQGGASAGKAIPAEVDASQWLADALREASNDVVQLLWRQTGGAAILVGVGFAIGVLASMLIFILFIEAKPVVYQVASPTAAQAATAAAAAGGVVAPQGGSSVASAKSARTSAQAEADAMAAVAAAAVPPTNAGAKKKE